MKQFNLTIAAFLIAICSMAQCESLELVNWTSDNDTTFTIQFSSPSVVSYELVLRTDYGAQDYPFEPVIISGEAQVGLNEVSVTFEDSPEGWPYPPYPVQPENVYFTTLLYYECEEGLNSDTTKFYMSRHSLVNTPGFECDSLITLFEPLPDGSGIPYQTTFTIPDNGEFIESLSVFLDIGHTFNGDLSIFLTHPNGTSVTLHGGQALTLGGSRGFSVVFTDLAEESIYNSNDTGAGPRGVFQPFGSFDPLIGLPVSGVWTLTIIDNFELDDGMVFGICLDIDGFFCEALLQGQVFADFNGDGEYSLADYSYPYPAIANSIDETVFYGNANGSFQNCTPEGSGNLSVLNAPDVYTTSATDFSVDEGEMQEGIDIMLIPEFEAVDLAVDLFSVDLNRPGFEATYVLSIQNNGTICEENGELAVSFPEYVDIIESENSDFVFSENEGSMGMIELCPFESLEFEFEVILEDTVSLGTELTAIAEAIPSEPDFFPADNTSTFTTEVIGAYDPNDKQVSRAVIGDEFLENQLALKYTIRFQNTGTFYAERVVIADTIDSNLDINSLQIISTSHNMELVREGNVLFFEYDQIFLPDSTTDPEGSIGYVRYLIDPLPSFSEGETIENTAYIYFDFNEAIVTNTVVTAFGNPLVTSNEDIFISLFPNPTNDRITAIWSTDFKPERVQVFDLTGRLIMEGFTRGSNFLEFDVSSLPRGLYIIRFIFEGQISENKFVKG